VSWERGRFGETLRHMNNRLLIAALGIAALASPAVASAADYGPNTCLNGFVWREAYSGDVVCVAPATRTRAAQDNAAAASRRDPNAGSGPYGCKSGYVWREARASDLVCVSPDIRTQAKADNAAAASRRNALTVSLSRANGNYVVNASGVNNGTATVGLYWYDTKRTITTFKVRVSGNRLSLNTGKPASCAGPTNAYFRVFDPSSGRSSSRLPIAYCVRID
jgi:hypothetical protein